MLSHCRKEVVMKILCVVSLWALLCSLGNCEDDQTIALVRSMNCQKELLFKTLYTRVRNFFFFFFFRPVQPVYKLNRARSAADCSTVCIV